MIFGARAWLSAALVVAVGGCDGPTEAAPPLEVAIATPSPNDVVQILPIEVTGTVVGSDKSTLSYTINGAARVHVDDAIREAGGAFRFLISDLPAGAVTLRVQADDGRRTGEAWRLFNHQPISLTVAADTNSIRYGTVIPFSGTVTPGARVRWSVNGGPESIVDQFSSLHRGEAHPLVNGMNLVVVRAYLGDQVAAIRRFTVEAFVPTRPYDVRPVAELPVGAIITGARMGNDGRVAGSWNVGTGTSFAFTWRDGALTHLSNMVQVDDVNNVGQVLGATAVSTSLIWKEGAYTPLAGPASAILLNDHGYLADRSTPGYWSEGQFVPYPADAINWSHTIADMNNSGAMVARALNSSGSGLRMVLAWLEPRAAAQVFDGGALYSRTLTPERISDAGHIMLAGSVSLGVPEFDFRTLVFHKGTVTQLGASAGFRFDGGGINTSGTVAGQYTHGSERRTTTWKDGRTTDVVLTTDDWNLVAVYDINDPGQILALAENKASGIKAFMVLTPVGTPP